MPQRERLAVIGAGVSGLTAAYLLQRRYDVTLFEAEDRLGGHAHTHRVITPKGDELAVDSGFIVFNNVTYPNLTRLLDEIGIGSVVTRMGMSVRCEGCGLVYAGGRGLVGLFASPRTSARPRFVRMLAEVARFQREARRYLAAGGDEQPLGDFLTAGTVLGVLSGSLHPPGRLGGVVGGAGHCAPVPHPVPFPFPRQPRDAGAPAIAAVANDPGRFPPLCGAPGKGAERSHYVYPGPGCRPPFRRRRSQGRGGRDAPLRPRGDRYPR